MYFIWVTLWKSFGETYISFLLTDPTKYSLQTFTNKFVNGDFVGGFLRYEKYRRIDVVRILIGALSLLCKMWLDIRLVMTGQTVLSL